MRKEKIKVKPLKILEGYLIKCPKCGHVKKTFCKIVRCNYCLHKMYVEVHENASGKIKSPD